jgi:hypothetical protein
MTPLKTHFMGMAGHKYRCMYVQSIIEKGPIFTWCYYLLYAATITTNAILIWFMYSL